MFVRFPGKVRDGDLTPVFVVVVVIAVDVVVVVVNLLDAVLPRLRR